MSSTIINDDLIANAIRQSIITFLDQSVTIEARYLPMSRWTTGENGRICNVYPEASIDHMFADLHFDAAVDILHDVMMAHFAQFLGLVGCRSFLMRHDARVWLQTLICEYWRRHHSLEIRDQEIIDLVSDFAMVLRSRTVRRYFAVPVINFHADPGTVVVVGKYCLRHLSDEEFNDLYSGPAFSSIPPHYLSPPDFALFGEIDEPIQFGNISPEASNIWKTVRDELDKVVVALRTFKPQPVGLGAVHVLRKGLPVLYSVELEYDQVPSGIYKINADEVQELQIHALRMNGRLHPSLDVASSRLSDAVARGKSRDRLIDAVIGLEAILLNGSSKAEYRGELRYRLSMNYAFLFTSAEERRKAFQIAKLFYDIRSSIAHGGTANEGIVTINRKKYVLADEADRACSCLREVIMRFIDAPEKPAYTEDNYWENQYFGVTYH